MERWGPLAGQQDRGHCRRRVLSKAMMVVDFVTTDLLCIAALLELSQAKSNPRLLQSRGRSFHMV
jgi:hypothetical protein